MRIQKIVIRGYRSIKDVEWQPGKLNVLIGPNGSGKSNLLRAIELLRFAVEGKLEQNLLRAGGIGSLVWDGKVNNLGWKLEAVPGSIRPGLPPPPNVKPRVKPDNEAVAYELVVTRFGFGNWYAVEQELLADYARVIKGEQQQPFKYLERDKNHAVFFDSQERKLTPPKDRVSDKETLLSQMGVMAGPLVFFFHSSIESWGIYHDLVVHEGAPVRQATVTRRQVRLDSDGQNLVAVLHTLYTTNRDFKKQLNTAMRAAFGREFEELEFPPAEDQRVQMRLHWKSLKSAQSTADISDGTLRFLMLIAILASPASGDFIAIDEPETNLHPSMFPILADLAAEASRTKQILLTTHSPEFLDALGPKQPTTTVVQNVEGETRLATVSGDDLQKWLKRYSLGQLFESGELEALV